MDRELDTFLKELELSGLRVRREGFFGQNGQVITIDGVNKSGVYWTDMGGGFHSLSYYDKNLGKSVEHVSSFQGTAEHLTKLIREGY